MLSYLGNAAELAHSKDCKQLTNNDLPSHVCSTFCPIATSMTTYLANAFSPRPASAKSMLSIPSIHSAVPEELTSEELTDSEGATNDTRATSVTTASRTKRNSGSSAKAAAKTTFRLAHPPPISIHKQNLHIRPRVLLQLQKVSETARPIPVLEVLPSFVFASRLARRFPRTFKGKAGLGADDLVIVGSEDYRSDGTEEGELDGIFEGDRWDKREIMAAICQPAKDEQEKNAKAEICLSSGASWTACRLASGAYEFTSIDEHGLKNVARWVPKQPKGSQRTANGGRERSMSEEKRFNFSLLNPNSRRHAIIANLDRQSIEVSTRYTHPPLLRQDTSCSTPTASVPSESGECSPNEPIEVTPALRSFIIVTGVFVSFREGFSSLFKLNDSAPNSPNLGTKHQRRALSMNSNHFTNEQMQSPTSSKFGDMHRTRSKLKHTNSSSTVPTTASINCMEAPVRRTTSSAGAFMQRVRNRNVSASKANRVTTVREISNADADKAPGSRDCDQVSRTSSLYSESTTPGSEDLNELGTVPSSGLDIVEEDIVAASMVAKRSRKLSRIFSMPRRTGRDR